MPEFIAEICSNHNGDLNRALALIDKAAEIGCAGVKFQLFRIDKLFAPEVLAHPDYQFVRDRRAWELPLFWLPVLAQRCKEREIKFGCTPFYLDAIEQLYPFVDFYKVASYSLLDETLLRLIAGTGKPVVLSTGMAQDWEVTGAVGILKDSGCKDLTLLHCVSIYPTPLRELNPSRVWHLRESHKTKSGYSDHSANPAAIYFIFGVLDNIMVEFHLDLDRQGVEYQIGHCWLPEQIKPVIADCLEMEMAWQRFINNEGIPDPLSESEHQERLWRADPSDGLRPLKEFRTSLLTPVQE